MRSQTAWSTKRLFSVVGGSKNYFVYCCCCWGGFAICILRHGTIRHNRLGERVMMERMFRLVELYGCYLCFSKCREFLIKTTGQGRWRYLVICLSHSKPTQTKQTRRQLTWLLKNEFENSMHAETQKKKLKNSLWKNRENVALKDESGTKWPNCKYRKNRRVTW